MPYLQIVVHVLHPPPSADSRQKGYPLPDFYSGATGNPAASVRDYCSGAYIQATASVCMTLRLIERPHVHVAFGRPGSAGDVAQPRGCQVEARLAVRECSNDTGSAANLFHDPLERIIGADLLPVDVRGRRSRSAFR